ncbi:alpha/beta-Hydrolase [Glarea lozoyensis ATCC 20868]|uniref:Alpha/beta-Hydrolase n=1 Tax=Glarea lozoyensis (strain ATCC 20868 / MF5171) TaxID=1116229 RepID=S3CR61_GLAL2|nr:alpha/beta-Hydrolase [Glarea lozoyensis ATCC 20868]EPE27594.1 alpha/beta-Hydrolase [Glarea lozoyensis ATCC 20868]
MSSPTQTTPSYAQISLPPKTSPPSAKHHLIYFITGNPGVIGLYDNFLNTLHTLISDSPTTSPESDIFSVYGRSLAGFEPATTFSSTDTQRTPYTLEEVIEVSLNSLESLRISDGPRKGQPFDNVILIGHSLGTWMALEIVQRLRKRSSPIKIRAAILLFATVTHIAKSPNGLRFTRLFKIPGFAKRVSTAAKTLVDLTPTRTLRWLVGVFARMPDEAAGKITRYLKSRMGIWQTFSLADEEMKQISEDRWDEEVWGVENKGLETTDQAPKLIFYFGKEDRWVSSETRDVLIAARGQSDTDSGSKPVMIVDKVDIPHDFCIRHSEIIAEKVAVWVGDIVGTK